MKTLVAAAAILAATTTAFAASDIKIQTLRTAGYWSAWYNNSNANGSQMCGMETSLSSENGARGTFYVKYAAGSEIFVHVSKVGWRIPKDAKMPLSLQFDSSGPYTGIAVTEDANMIGFKIKDTVSKLFMQEFADANMMVLRFGEGSERPWTFDMRGSREVSTAFIRCMSAISGTQPYGGASTPSQPYGNSGTSQPYSTTPSKPQPILPSRDQI